MARPISDTRPAKVYADVLRGTSTVSGTSEEIARFLPYREAMVWSALYALAAQGQVERTKRPGLPSLWRRVR